MLSGFHHITLRVRDLEASKRFYETLPGFVIDQDFPGRKVRFRIGAAEHRLVLAPPLPGTPDDDRFSERRIGLDHLAVGVPQRSDIDALRRVLDELAAPVSQGDDHGAAVLVFRDPDNFQWEFFEQV